MPLPSNSNYLTFRAAGTSDVLTIQDSGNVGIGTTGPNYKCHIVGTLGFNPGSAVTPVNNGDVVIELTNNTTLTFRARGSDGVVRSVSLTLA
jgi:peptidoglycan hydrolase-like protein with peptidoglycan-binding domain